MKSGNNPVKKAHCNVHVNKFVWDGCITRHKKNSNVIHNVLNLNLLHVVHKKRISDLWFLSAMSNKKQRARAEKESERITSPICLCAGFKGSLSGFIGTVPQCYQCRLNSVISAINPFSITLPGSLPCNGLHSCMTLIWYMVWPPRL